MVIKGLNFLQENKYKLLWLMGKSIAQKNVLKYKLQYNNENNKILLKTVQKAKIKHIIEIHPILKKPVK